jgi:FtsP/CotA-like multicopper oxidase with cupredoxin domain
MNHLTRRDFLKCAGMGGLIVCSNISAPGLIKTALSEEIREYKLNASVAAVNVGTGKSFKAWTYNGQLPGPEIRIKEGETFRAVLKNYLSEGTTIHWHGLPVPNKMDGVPNVTQDPVQPGQSFIYEFQATPPGTYIYHAHFSYQLDRGLYGPLIIEPKKEERSYDREYVLTLEGWATVDGVGPKASKMGRISPGMGMMGMMGMMRRQAGAGEPLQEPLRGKKGAGTLPVFFDV